MSENVKDGQEGGSDERGLDRRTFLQYASLAGVSAAAVSEVTTGAPGQDPNRDREDEIVIGVPEDVDNVQAKATELSPSGAEVVDVNETLGFAVVSVPEGADAAEEVSTLSSHGDVRYVEENGKKQALFQPPSANDAESDDEAGSDALTPNDTYFGHQYAPQQVKAPKAWEKTTGSPDVTIAIIDTGTKYDHEDLAANMDDSVANHGYDFVDNDSDPYPEDFSSGGDAEDHGTHVSGIAGAVTDNGVGVAGISDCSLLAVRVLGTDGWGWHSDIASGIQWAADNGADVINLSLGSDGESSTMGDALEYAYNAGVFIVASAGNDAEEKTSYGPASQPQCMAVSSVDDNEDLSSFSNYGDYVEITAPGSSVLSTYPADLNDGGASDEYAYMSGTSMSAPVVAGVAGLTLSRLDWLSNDELRAHLKNTADDIGLTDKEQGAGRVNAESAVSVPEHNHLGSAWSGTSSPGLEIEIDSGDALVARTTSTGNDFDFGVVGRTNAQSGRGVAGFADNTSGNSIALLGRNQSEDGVGIRALCDAETGSTNGIFGQVRSASGRGIYATNTSDSGGPAYGCVGQSNSTGGTGVLGTAIADSGSTIGVRGQTNSPNGYGVYSDGDMHVDGDFSASGTKNFVQTVTTDDGQKEVAYTAVEADTAHTETSGVATLTDGRVTVELPEHFGLVTSEKAELTVQVTPHSTNAAGPAVTDRTTDRIVIEDLDGDGEYEVSYTVRGTRAGYEDGSVVTSPSRTVSPDGPSIPDHNDR